MSVTESELVRGDWADPLRGSELLADFGERWIAEHRVSQRVREEYDSLWRHHLDPYLGTSSWRRSPRRRCGAGAVANVAQVFALADAMSAPIPRAGPHRGVQRPALGELIALGWSGRPGSNRHGQLGRLRSLRRQGPRSAIMA